MASRVIVALLFCVIYNVAGYMKGLRNFEAEVDVAFNKYVKDYGKSYASRDEYDMRKATFLKNWKMIEHHNNQHRSYTMRINKFADQTDEELTASQGATTSIELPTEMKAFPYTSDVVQNLAKFLPKNFDMRNEGYITPVKAQGECSSCWAFAATAAVEGALARKRGGSFDLSEQTLVDCVPPPPDTNGGCEGNSVRAALDYIQAKGLPMEEEYPYEGVTDICHADYMVTTHKIDGYMQPTPLDPTALKVALYFHGPAAVQMHLSPHLWFFDRGVFYDKECNSGGIHSRNHSLIVVGYGNRDGVDYWVLKNSHGIEWGNEGYARISAKDDNCFVLTNPLVPIVSV